MIHVLVCLGLDSGASLYATTDRSLSKQTIFSISIGIKEGHSKLLREIRGCSNCLFVS